MPRNPDFLPDWFVGGAGKRKLLTALAHPEKGLGENSSPWSKTALAQAAGVHTKHTVFRHLEVLVLAELLHEGSGGYSVNHDSVLLGPIRSLTTELDRLEPHPLPRSRGNH